MDKIKQLLTRGVEGIIVKENLEKRLRKGEKLRVKHGVDPTTRDLHIGYAVVYWKLRDFQDLGHKIVFLIGNFTARFGDPTDEAKTREMRKKSEVEALAKNYLKQLSKILDLDKVEVRYNGEWYDKWSWEQGLCFMSKFSVARVLERDMFQERIKKGKEIQYHEPVYPMLQGYDSVELKSDVTVIGSDQKFNELQARPLQQEAGQTPQDLVIVPLLLGTGGKRKMSQSLGNYIGINEPPEEQYGKTMSIPDKLLKHYFELATRLSQQEIEEILRQEPRDAKARLAREIVSLYHGEKAAEKAEQEFNKVFRDKKIPSKIPELKTASKDLVEILVQTKLASSKADAKRLIKQGAVKKRGDVLQVGKRGFVRIKI